MSLFLVLLCSLFGAVSPSVAVIWRCGVGTSRNATDSASLRRVALHIVIFLYKHSFYFVRTKMVDKG